MRRFSTSEAGRLRDVAVAEAEATTEFLGFFSTPEAGRLLSTAVGLISEEGENPEYDRACAEVVTEFLGFSMDEKPEVLSMLRFLRRAR